LQIEATPGEKSCAISMQNPNCAKTVQIQYQPKTCANFVQIYWTDDFQFNRVVLLRNFLDFNSDLTKNLQNFFFGKLRLWWGRKIPSNSDSPNDQS
jgi:hypothetical protein